MATIKPNTPATARPGFKKIEFIDIENVLTYLRLKTGISLGLLQNAEVNCLEGAKISQQCQPDEHNAYSHSITATMGARQSFNQDQLYKWQQKGFVVILTDYNGNQWLAGAPLTPLHLEWNENDSGNPEDGCPLVVTFAGSTLDPLLHRL